MASGSGWQGTRGKRGLAKARRERYRRLRNSGPRQFAVKGKGRRTDNNYLPF